MYMINIIIIIIVIIIIIIIITILLSSHTCDGAEAVGQHCSQERLTDRLPSKSDYRME